MALLVGGLVAWMMSTFRCKPGFLKKLADSERRANTAQRTIRELRTQAEKADRNFHKANFELTISTFSYATSVAMHVNACRADMQRC